ncbi:MAG TPA: FadR/GntR family transcriptional regulator [Anaerolineae bacterium]|nr:FadR/GntR family transcriptional regulator [Anaerolineae bacterium]HOQ97401.1 FadR/GntR family transcriptional regulator [Anaerolineae bacterium]HPL27174.1 FadR/GntR family transcriptional regulator [Anaerolineae bacterium]
MTQAPLPRDSLTDAIIRELKQMILRGDVLPGGWLPPQPALAQRFGVGLSTIREAVKGLTLLGVLKPQPGRGTQVCDDALSLLRRFDPVGTRLAELDVFQILEARDTIEVELAGLAAERATEEDIAAIQGAIAAMRQVRGDDVAYEAADLEFHRSIARAARSRLLEEFYNTTLTLMAAVAEQIIPLPGVKERGLTFQQSVADAISAHDRQAARQRTHKHMRRVLTILRTSLSMRGDSAAQGE